MMLTRLILFSFLSALVYGQISESNTVDNYTIPALYAELGIDHQLDWEVFCLAMLGYNRLVDKNIITNASKLTIIDFSKASTEERLFILDLRAKKIIRSSLVAHGKNSGWNYAKVFSNISGSLTSSLGFYMTTNTYYGKHGYSLKLRGMESSINDRAEKRAIVIHGANYVSRKFIDKYGRLGRSWGCPALPVDLASDIIDEIKDGTCLFIYAENGILVTNQDNSSLATTRRRNAFLA